MSVPNSDRGSGSSLAAIVTLAVTGIGLGVLLVVGWIGGIHQARSAADLAAVSGAQAFDSGTDPCEAARQVAERFRVRIDECLVEGDSIDFVISIRVTLESVRPLSIGAQAAAGHLASEPP